MKLIKEFADKVETLYIVEELEAVIEEQKLMVFLL